MMEFLTWHEAHSFVMRVSKSIHEQLTLEDDIYRILCRKLVEMEIANLLERSKYCTEKHTINLLNLELFIEKQISHSNCQVRICAIILR